MNKQTNYKQTGIGEIPQEWNIVPLRNLIDIKHGFAFKGKYFSNTATQDILLTPGNVAIGGGYQEGKHKYYSGEVPQEYVMEPGDIFVNMTDLSKTGDTLGYSAKVPHHKSNRFLHNQRLGLVSFISNDINRDFIYWKLRDPFYRSNVLGSATGTTVKHTSPGRIKSIQIALPAKNEQQQIASILTSLDDKIELNRKMNKTLEEMGKALFKRWFVDFEFPNEQGKPYKSSGGEMVDSELGEIPKEWKVQSLDEIAVFLNGLACQKYPPVDDEDAMPVIKIADLRGGFSANSDMASSKVDDKYHIYNGDVLFSWSGSLELCLWPYGDGILNQHLFKVTSDIFPKWFYYYWTLEHLPNFRSIASGKATTMGHIQRIHLTHAKVLVPNNQALELMSTIMQPLLEKIISNNQEIALYKGLRDSLLPRLMSGKLRVN